MSESAKNAITHKGPGGISAKRVLIPIAVFIFCLHMLIVGNTIRINRAGQGVSKITQRDFMYSQISWTYEDGIENLADKVYLFVNSGDENYVDAYFRQAEELDSQSTVFAQMSSGDSTDRADEEIGTALAAAQARRQIELRAIRLCLRANSAAIERYPQLASAALTAQEEALSAAERKETALGLLISPEYMQNKSLVHEHISRAVQAVTEQSSESVRQQAGVLGSYQGLQWTLMLVVITILITLCVLLFTMLLIPLEHSVEKIQNGEPLPDDKGLSEFRRLAYSYNELLHHRKMTESYLRRQSQTDALTKLSNRLAYQDYISRLSWDKPHASLTVFSLDVNGLKEANDSLGHSHGDDLLKQSAACILDAFGGGDGKQCFRFGGDEFAAIWVDVPADEIEGALEKFREFQNAHEVSISVGYAHADDLSETTMDALFNQADKCMYEEKVRYHRELDASHEVHA